MRIAYVACSWLTKDSGVPKKFSYQVNAWRSMGADVEFFCVSPDANDPEILMNGELIFRSKSSNPIQQWREDRKAFGELIERVEAWKPDLIYLRWGFHKPEYCQIAKKYPTVIELNGDIKVTASLTAKRAKGLRRFLGRYVELSVPWLFREAAGFLAVTHEVAKLDYVTKWQKPIGVVPNSISLAEYSVLPEPEPKNKKPRVAFLANMAPWHGLDKVVAFAKTVEDELEFEIVGTERGHFAEQSNVHFHGYLEKSDFLKVLEGCDVGLDGTALYRKQMDEACALKVREYLACGLPIVICAEDTALLGQEPWWLLRMGNREGNLSENRERFVSFCRQAQGRRVSHAESEPLIHVDCVEKERLNFLKSVLV